MPPTVADPRAYLQRRVALFSGAGAVFFGLLLVADFATPAPGEPFFSSSRISSLLALTATGSAWWFCSRGRRSAGACRAAELTAMAAVGAAFIVLPLFPPVPGGGGVMGIFAPLVMSAVVSLRAAIIPSSAWLSALVAAAWGLAGTATSVLGWESIVFDFPVPELRVENPWLFPLAIGLFAMGCAAFVSGIISHVVHGLATQVRKATELGQYTLEAKIGEGGMGTVYRARHRLLRRPTAVKLLPPGKSSGGSIARFEREVQHTSRLTHPNTVAIFDYGRTSDGIFYYAMEYLDGLTLRDIVTETGPLPPSRAVHLMIQAASALAEAHSLGLVHRDIKPDNIMVCRRGGIPDVVKVLDFGLVKDFASGQRREQEVRQQTGPRAAPEAGSSRDSSLDVARERHQELSADTIMGTPLYMAPEAVSTPEDVDARADIYALGAVLYFLLTGRPLFRGNLIEVLGHHLHTDASTRVSEMGVGEQLTEVVRRCLEKERERRFPSAKEFLDALTALPERGSWTPRQAQTWWLENGDLVLELKREDAASNERLTVAI
ncbi:MAG: serine/threonine-protein kinase [Sandaracinaceae bacterium]